MRDILQAEGRFTVVCYRDGVEVWRDSFPNTVVTAGKNDLLTNYFKGAAYTAAFYLGLKNSAGGVVAGDTMGSHAGWTESSAYSNGTRPAATFGSASGGSIDNSGSPATFNINGTDTIYGAFLTTNNTKGGSTGTLYSAGDFGASRAVASGDVLSVTWTGTV